MSVSSNPRVDSSFRVLSKVYRYLYYRMYCVNKATWFGYSEPPHLQNVGGIFAFQFLNLLTIFLIWYGLADHVLLDEASVILVLATLYFLNYRAGAGGRHIAFIQEFKNESKKDKRIRGIFFWSYLVISFLLPFSLIYFLFYNNP